MLNVGDIVITKRKLRGVVISITKGDLADTALVMLSPTSKTKGESLAPVPYSLSGLNPYNKALNIEKVIGNIFNIVS